MKRALLSQRRSLSSSQTTNSYHPYRFVGGGAVAGLFGLVINYAALAKRRNVGSLFCRRAL